MKHSVHSSNWACMHIVILVNELVHNCCQWILSLDQVNIIIKSVVDWTSQGKCKQTLSHPPVCRNQYCQAKLLTGQGHSPTNSRWQTPSPQSPVDMALPSRGPQNWSGVQCAGTRPQMPRTCSQSTTMCREAGTKPRKHWDLAPLTSKPGLVLGKVSFTMSKTPDPGPLQPHSLPSG